MRRWLLIAAASVGVAVAGGARAESATTITVVNGHDSGAGSLRQAITDAGAGDTIVVPAGTGVVLTSGALLVTKPITIAGGGSAHTQISANGTSRVLDIEGPVAVTVSGVLISGGDATAPSGGTAVGGGILVHGGSLTLSNSVVTQNTAETSPSGISEGGGIAADTATSSLTLLSTIVSDNRVLTGGGGDAWGGGIYATGALVVRGSSIDGNTASISGAGSAAGGGIFYRGAASSTAPATLENTSVSGNQTATNGQTATDGGGDAFGGGLDAAGAGGVTITDVTVANNALSANGGANGQAGFVEGGGVHIGTPGGTIVNATIADNSASATGTSIGLNSAVYGGGLTAVGVKVLSSTIVANSITSGAPGITIEAGNLLGVSNTMPVHVKNSIVAQGAGPRGTENCVASPAIVSDGHNIDSTDQCGFHAGGDQPNTDPALRPLAGNGGPVQTIALEPGSLAIDAADSSGCPSTDARGVLRPAGTACDVGAFEVATPIAVTGSATSVGSLSATMNGTATNPDLAGGTVSFQFGTTLAYGSTTPSAQIGPTTSAAAFHATAAGLTAGTTYHFREVVRNAVGTALGPDRTFTTTQAPAGGTTGGGHASASAHVTRLTVRIACGTAAQCPITAVATAIETVRGHKVLGVTRRARGRGHRKVVAARISVTIAAGNTRTVTLRLTAVGRSLMRKFGAVPVTVTVSLLGQAGKPTVIATAKPTIGTRH